MRDLYVETLRGLRAEYDDKLVKDSFDYAIDAITNRRSVTQTLNEFLNELRKLHTSENEIIERLPEDLDYHVWIRRVVILAEQIAEKYLNNENRKGEDNALHVE